MEELKPCPHCKGEAKLCHGLPSTQNRGPYQAFARCKKCGCRTKTIVQCAYESKADVDKAAVALWNRRAEPENKVLMCEGCAHESDIEFPCDFCSRNFKDRYAARKPKGSEP